MPGKCFPERPPEWACKYCGARYYFPREQLPSSCPACGGCGCGRSGPFGARSDWAKEVKYTEIDASHLFGEPQDRLAQACDEFRRPSAHFEIPGRGWTIRVTCSCGSTFTETLPARGHGKVLECHTCGFRLEMTPAEEELRK